MLATCFPPLFSADNTAAHELWSALDSPHESHVEYVCIPKHVARHGHVHQQRQGENPHKHPRQGGRVHGRLLREFDDPQLSMTGSTKETERAVGKFARTKCCREITAKRHRERLDTCSESVYRRLHKRRRTVGTFPRNAVVVSVVIVTRAS